MRVIYCKILLHARSGSRARATLALKEKEDIVLLPCSRACRDGLIVQKLATRCPNKPPYFWSLVTNWWRCWVASRMLQTLPGSRDTSSLPVNTTVHRATRRVRGLPLEVDDIVLITLTNMISTSVQTSPTGTENTKLKRYTLESPQVPATLHPKEREDVED